MKWSPGRRGSERDKSNDHLISRTVKRDYINKKRLWSLSTFAAPRALSIHFFYFQSGIRRKSKTHIFDVCEIALRARAMRPRQKMSPQVNPSTAAHIEWNIKILLPHLLIWINIMTNNRINWYRIIILKAPPRDNFIEYIFLRFISQL